jgi:hypothetical protein
MTTMTIRKSDIRSFQNDLKLWKVRHGPFRRILDNYQIEILSLGSKITMLRLKYG